MLKLKKFLQEKHMYTVLNSHGFHFTTIKVRPTLALHNLIEAGLAQWGCVKKNSWQSI